MNIKLQLYTDQIINWLQICLLKIGPTFTGRTMKTTYIYLNSQTPKLSNFCSLFWV
jgi:hypothetical protein